MPNDEVPDCIHMLFCGDGGKDRCMPENERRISIPGLLTREEIERRIRSGYTGKKRMTAALLDVDFFANLNEKIGAEQGDLTLRRMAAFLAGIHGLSAAYSGEDEFLLLLWETEQEEVRRRLENLREEWRRTRFVGAYPYEKVRITFSMGVAGSHQAADLFTLLKHTEIALFNAKKMGRNRIVYAEPDKITVFCGEGRCTTVVGGSLKGRGRDGERAFGAAISEPYGVAVDRDGSLLFADRSNHRIVRVTGGKLYTAAGNTLNEIGFTDGIQAGECRPDPLELALCKPSGVCIGGSGVMYIADTGHHRILQIRDGRASVLAGSGISGYDGDGSEARRAKMNRPGGVAADCVGNVYINDYGNNVVRRISKEGTIETVAGSGAFGFSGDGGDAGQAALDRPYGLCVSRSGDMLYIADYGNNRIRRVNLADGGKIQTVCGCGKAGFGGDGGKGADAYLNGPYWVCLDSAEEWLYIADALNHRIRRWHVQKDIVETAAGCGIAGYTDSLKNEREACFHIPAGVTADKNYLYIADYANNAIRRVVLS